MTTVIEFYAGPGAGKSTIAADLYAQMKKASKSVELVREYVKDWAYRDHTPGPWDQPYLVAKQLRAESTLYGRVDYIITDSPLSIGIYYEGLGGTELAKPMVEAIRRQQADLGIAVRKYFVLRTKPYDPRGRWGTEQDALDADLEIKRLCPGALGVCTAAEVLEDLIEKTHP